MRIITDVYFWEYVISHAIIIVGILLIVWRLKRIEGAIKEAKKDD